MPGKPNPPRINLTAAVWTLSHYLPMVEREVGETVLCVWPEDGEHYEAEIVEKYEDGTYDVYFPDEEMVVEAVEEKDFEPFKGALSSNYFTHTCLIYTTSFTHSLKSFSHLCIV